MILVVATHKSTENKDVIRVWGVWKTVNLRRLFHWNRQPYGWSSFREVRSGPLADAGLRPATQREPTRAQGRRIPCPVPECGKRNCAPCPRRGPLPRWHPSPPGRVTQALHKWGRVSGPGRGDRTHAGVGSVSFPFHPKLGILGVARQPGGEGLFTARSTAASSPFCSLRLGSLLQLMGGGGREGPQITPSL